MVGNAKHGLYLGQVRRYIHAILVLCAAALLAPGSGGLRSLHLAHAGGAHAALAGCDHSHHGHAHAELDADAGHDGCPGDEPSEDASPAGSEPAPHDERTCTTCELLLSLAGTAGAAIEAPAFHALVAVRDDGAPARLPAPMPPRALSARPPPAC